MQTGNDTNEDEVLMGYLSEEILRLLLQPPAVGRFERETARPPARGAR